MQRFAGVVGQRSDLAPGHAGLVTVQSVRRRCGVGAILGLQGLRAVQVRQGLVEFDALESLAVDYQRGPGVPGSHADPRRGEQRQRMRLTRAGLVRAVLAKHRPVVEERRHALLDACEGAAGDPGAAAGPGAAGSAGDAALREGRGWIDLSAADVQVLGKGRKRKSILPPDDDEDC